MYRTQQKMLLSRELGVSPLVYAIEEGGSYEQYIPKYVNKYCTVMHSFPLSAAVRFDRVNVVRLLLEARAVPDCRNPLTGNTPLMAAVHRPSCSMPIIRMLLKHGADPTLTNGCGASAVIWSVKFNQYCVLALFLRNGVDPNMPISWADYIDHYDRLLSVAAGSSLGSRMCDLLTAYGADILHKTNHTNRQSAISIAAEKGHWRTVMVLSALGADRSSVRHTRPDIRDWLKSVEKANALAIAIAYSQHNIISGYAPNQHNVTAALDAIKNRSVVVVGGSYLDRRVTMDAVNEYKKKWTPHRHAWYQNKLFQSVVRTFTFVHYRLQCTPDSPLWFPKDILYTILSFA